ncbi:MAG TPA: zinc-dependent metalloprotease [Labilithrix sp.]|nr:zinc-dependent metalloprotease [Labilithrix sp.]
MGCASDRPARNGIFNENVYLKKSFLIRQGTAGAEEDDGWMLKATILSTSTPNPLANTVVWSGAENNGAFVRFVATQNNLQLVNIRELSDSKEIQDQGTRNPEVVDSWPATHVDLKYRVNLDGEKTNFLEENQELDWRQRQYVKVDLHKPDLSDFALFGPQTTYVIQKCASGGTLGRAAAVSVVPDSVIVDEPHDYLEWKVNVTVPLDFDDEACWQAFGEDGATFQRLGRSNVSAVLKVSMTRAKPRSEITYKTMELGEKDPIRRKYGPITMTSWARDQDTGMLGAREFAIRFDPEKELVWYFAKGYPEEYKSFFLAPNGIVDQTNRIFEKAGAKVRLVVKNYDEDLPEDWPEAMKERGREYGDVRFNFIRWMSDIDTGAPFIGVAQFVPDPRTGEALSASVNIADFPLKEYVAQRLDAYLQTIVCHASETENADGVTAQVCSNINTDQPWGPPLQEIQETREDGVTVTKLTPMPETCQDGDVAPIIPSTLAKTYGNSTLFSKMQEYLGEPVSQYGNLGPKDFTTPQDEDFFRAYFQILPYYVFADPDTNQFVVPEGGGGVFGPEAQFDALRREAEFHKAAAAIDRGYVPYDDQTGPNFATNAAAFLNGMQGLQLAHREYLYKQQFAHKSTTKLDSANDVISFIGVMQKAGRHCVNGHWETKEEWLKNLVTTYHALTVWHEFGHVLGLDHNFMASVDRPNYPHYTDKQGRDHIGMYQSSVMEYNATPDRVFWANESGGAGWGPYDRGAIGWLYANEGSLSEQTRAEYAEKTKTERAKGISGQLSASFPWKDPEGFRADGSEISFLYCNASHIKYTPLCRTFDFGSTPSEIVASELENYEWQYAWRNFRKYRKVWDNGQYAGIPAQEIYEMRRFLSQWGFDWSGAVLIDDFRRIGIEPPPGAPAIAKYYAQLAQKFDREMSSANQMVAAFHKAVIQQASGERPYRTIYDKYFGDVTQQGIILDKLFAMQGWVGMWPADNYDPNKAGSYIASFTTIGDEEYRAVAEDSVASMIGEQLYDAYPYFKPLAVVQFAKDTHSPSFSGRVEIRDWVGGRVFTRERDMLDYFRSLAVKHGHIPAEYNCTSLETCTYDPTVRRVVPGDTHLSDDYHEFLGPDSRRYAWVYVADRHTWVFADKDRNTATYKILNDFNIQVIKGEDDGASPGYAYWVQLPVKYFLDAYNAYN